MSWFCLPVAVMMVIRQGGNVLLAKRANTGFKDGYFALPGGKHDGDETITDAVVREAREELGIIVDAADVRFSCLIHAKLIEPKMELMYVTFEIMQFQGDIINNEPHKCTELQFFPVEQLPDQMTEMSRRCVMNTVAGITFDEAGWLETIDAPKECE
ncbi:MAG: NUDIX domain-containing protein [Pseudomonadota bacterium]|nr:NUDIX domain-containing protein [Pseudomonadota bacterium]